MRKFLKNLPPNWKLTQFFLWLNIIQFLVPRFLKVLTPSLPINILQIFFFNKVEAVAMTTKKTVYTHWWDREKIHFPSPCPTQSYILVQTVTQNNVELRESVCRGCWRKITKKVKMKMKKRQQQQLQQQFI